MGSYKRMITVVEWHCGRCGHSWKGRMEREPKVCSSCKSSYWNKPRQRKRAMMA